MSNLGRREPESVPDTLKPQYDAAMRQQAAHNAQQDAARHQNYADTVDLAGGVLRGMEAIPEIGAAASGWVDDAVALSRVKKFIKPVDRALTALSAEEGYRADRARGVARPKAMLRQGGKVANEVGMSAAGAEMGVALGAFGGPVVGAIGGVVGGYGGPYVLPMARDAVEAGFDTPYWRDIANKATSPLYFARSLGFRGLKD